MVSSVSLALLLPLPFPQFLELEGKGYDGVTPFRVEYSKASHYAYFLAVDLCICSYLVQEEAVLKMAGQAPDV